MFDLLVIKNKDVIYIAATPWQSTSIMYDNINNINNFPLRIINTKYGKVIIHTNTIARDGQIILAHSETILRNAYIDRTFLRNTYIKRINDILNDESNFDIKDFIITIVFDNKIYVVYTDGNVIEKEEYSSDGELLTTYKGNKSLDNNKRIEKSFKQFYLINNTFQRMYLIATDTNNYKIKFIER